jgi:predicted dehydrogenase
LRTALRNTPQSKNSLTATSDVSGASSRGDVTEARHVAQAYVRVAGDFVNGTDTAPNFNDALVRHRMIDAIEQAARTGSQASYDTSNPGAVETSRLST